MPVNCRGRWTGSLTTARRSTAFAARSPALPRPTASPSSALGAHPSRGGPCYGYQMLPKEKIEALVSRVRAIDERLSAPIDRDSLVKLSKERAELEPVYLAIADLQGAEKEREGLTVLLDDPEMGLLAAEEAEALDQRIEALTEKVRLLLLPKDAADEK